MRKIKTEGIVIQAIPFKEHDRIITVFTPHEGLLKLINTATLKTSRGTFGIDPLACVELICQEGRGDLFKCIEISVLDLQLHLRTNLPILTAGCNMVQAVALTQQAGRAAQDLYELLKAYLLRLPIVHQPAALVSSFRLKTLRTEGLFSPYFECSRCDQGILHESYHAADGVYCPSHAPADSLSFSNEERDLLLLLAFCRDFSLLKELELEQQLITKISRLFDQSIMRTTPYVRK